MTARLSPPHGSDAAPRWRGRSAAERAAERRARLIEAGLDAFSDNGYAGSSVQGVCRAAGPTERYFYESFADREAMLLAIVAEITGGMRAAVGRAVARSRDDRATVASLAIGAALDHLLEDPRRGRVLLIETFGVSARVEEQRRSDIAQLVGWLSGLAGGSFVAGESAPLEVELGARSTIGAAEELMIASIRGEISVDRDRLVSHLVGLLLAGVPDPSSGGSRA